MGSLKNSQIKDGLIRWRCFWIKRFWCLSQLKKCFTGLRRTRKLHHSTPCRGGRAWHMPAIYYNFCLYLWAHLQWKVPSCRVDPWTPGCWTLHTAPLWSRLLRDTPDGQNQREREGQRQRIKNKKIKKNMSVKCGNDRNSCCSWTYWSYWSQSHGCGGLWRIRAGKHRT